MWHRAVTERAGNYTANRAKSHLKSILALAEEDFGVRPPSMPAGIGRGRQKVKKAILTPDLIPASSTPPRADPEHGIYYAFPFLAGTRPSEQLGLLWEDVDFDDNVIHIRRIQERDGSLTEMTKTEAGTRDMPMGATLREMLLAWRVRCPRKRSELHRVFPGPGRLEPWPKPRSVAAGRCSTRTFAAATGSRSSSGSACPTSRRTRRGIRSSARCRRRASRSASSPSSPATPTRSSRSDTTRGGTGWRGRRGGAGESLRWHLEKSPSNRKYLCRIRRWFSVFRF